MRLIFKRVMHGFFSDINKENQVFLCVSKTVEQFPDMTEEMKDQGFELQIFHRPGKNRKRFILKRNAPDSVGEIRLSLSSCTILSGKEVIEGDISVKHFATMNNLFNRAIYVKIVPLPDNS